MLERSGADVSAVSSAVPMESRRSLRDDDDDDSGRKKKASLKEQYQQQGVALSGALGDGAKPFYCFPEYGAEHKDSHVPKRTANKEQLVLPESATEADIRRVVSQQRADRDKQRKILEDPMLKVAQSLGDSSFLQPHTKPVPSFDPEPATFAVKRPRSEGEDSKSHHHHRHRHHRRHSPHRHHHGSRKSHSRHHRHHRSSDSSSSSDTSSSSSSRSSSSDDSSDDEETKRLRAERLKREKRERIRTQQLLRSFKPPTPSAPPPPSTPPPSSATASAIVLD